MDGYQVLLVGTFSAGVLLLASLLTVRMLDERADRNLSVGLTRLLERAKMEDLVVSQGLAENLSKIRFPLRKYTDSVAYHSRLEDVVKLLKTTRFMEKQGNNEGHEM